MDMRRALLAGVVALVLLPSSLFAQDDRRSHFGVIATFSPSSDLRDKFKMLFDAERFDISSQDFEIGVVVRGRHLGGDWGVSYVQKKYKEGSFADNTEDVCFQSCFRSGTLSIFHDVQLRGVSIHKFAPFVTIKRRAQIGLNFSGGVAQAHGHAERHEFDAQFSPPNSNVQTESATEIDAKDLFADGEISTIPIWKVEIVGALLVAPGLKVRVGGGLNFTNYPAASVSAVYLFGSK
jgi:hypothetical protein